MLVAVFVKVGEQAFEPASEDRNDLNRFCSGVGYQRYFIPGLQVRAEFLYVSVCSHANLHLCVAIPYCPCPISGHLTTLSE